MKLMLKYLKENKKTKKQKTEQGLDHLPSRHYSKSDALFFHMETEKSKSVQCTAKTGFNK